MARSIFAMLNRRFGDPVAGGEMRRRAAQHLESARGAPAVDFSDASRLGGVKPKLAIVGAGFAGCAAHLTKTDLDVRIFDPFGRAGGRVWSSLPSDLQPVVPGRVVEQGGRS
jgi:NADPH-dependent 2,4-dienoyl-CoA reductase/sulfur reductase-like enzyme